MVAYYWTIQTLFTVGYGDVPLVNYKERGFAIVWMISGIGFYSLTIGNFTQAIMDLDKNNEQLTENFRVLASVGKKKNLPEIIQSRIRRHLTNQQYQKTYKDSENLYALLPVDLRTQLMEKTHRGVLEKVRFFRNQALEFNAVVVHELRPIFLMEGDLLYS